MLVDVDLGLSDIHDRCEIVKLMVYLRWQLKHTSWSIEAAGYSSDCMNNLMIPLSLGGGP